MSSIIPHGFETFAPSEADSLLARESIRLLDGCKYEQQESVRLQLGDDVGGKETTVSVPANVVRLLVRMLSEMSQGNAVTLIPTHAELTTQQAASLLNVSRPYVVKLLDEGKIPSRTVGKYRRVRFDDLMAFKKKDDDARAKVLDQLTAEAQELGMGY